MLIRRNETGDEPTSTFAVSSHALGYSGASRFNNVGYASSLPYQPYQLFPISRKLEAYATSTTNQRCWGAIILLPDTHAFIFFNVHRCVRLDGEGFVKGIEIRDDTVGSVVSG